jgi:hypothetical protein
VSLYQVQKLIWQLNLDLRTQERFLRERDTVLAEYDLTEEERTAIVVPDIGLLHVLGVNGQLLMHFAALYGIEWPDRLERMCQGLKQHGQVREGVYAANDREGLLSCADSETWRDAGQGVRATVQLTAKTGTGSQNSMTPRPSCRRRCGDESTDLGTTDRSLALPEWSNCI